LASLIREAPNPVRIDLLYDLATSYLDAGQPQAALDLSLEMDEYSRDRFLCRAVNSSLLVGDILAALRIVESIRGFADRVTSLGEIVSALSRNGKDDEACAVAKSLARAACAGPDNEYRGWLYQTVAVLISVGCIDEAALIARAVNDVERIAALRAVVRGYASTGQRDAALSHARMAANAFQSLDQEQVTTDLLSDVAVALAIGESETAALVWIRGQLVAPDSHQLAAIAEDIAAAGCLQSSIDLAMSNADPADRDTTIERIARRLASDSKVRESLTVALQLEDRLRRLSLLNDLTQSRLIAGESAEALEVSNAALREAVAQGQPDPINRAREYSTRALVALGRLEDAFAMTRQIQDSWQRTNLLSELVQAYAERGKVEGVIAVIQEVQEEEQRRRFLCDAVRILLGIAKPHLGLTIAHMVDQAAERAKALVDVSLAFSAGDDQRYSELAAGEALDATREIRDREWRTAVLTDIARRLMDAGRLEQASAAIHGIDDSAWRANLGAEVADALARIQRFDAAIAEARQIEEPSWRIEALARIARLLVREGRIDEGAAAALEAMAAVDALEDYSERGRSYARLAKILARCGRLQDARRAAERCHEPAERLSAYAGILVGAAVLQDQTTSTRFEDLNLPLISEIITEIQGR